MVFVDVKTRRKRNILKNAIGKPTMMDIISKLDENVKNVGIHNKWRLDNDKS